MDITSKWMRVKNNPRFHAFDWRLVSMCMHTQWDLTKLGFEYL